MKNSSIIYELSPKHLGFWEKMIPASIFLGLGITGGYMWIFREDVYAGLLYVSASFFPLVHLMWRVYEDQQKAGIKLTEKGVIISAANEDTFVDFEEIVHLEITKTDNIIIRTIDNLYEIKFIFIEDFNAFKDFLKEWNKVIESNIERRHTENNQYLHEISEVIRKHQLLLR